MKAPESGWWLGDEETKLQAQYAAKMATLCTENACVNIGVGMFCGAFCYHYLDCCVIIIATAMQTTCKRSQSSDNGIQRAP